MGSRLGLRNKDVFAPLWVYDFPLLEWDEETQRFYADTIHSQPPSRDLDKFYSDDPRDLEQVNANAYDFVLNGTEIGRGVHKDTRCPHAGKDVRILGMTEEEVNARVFLHH